MPGEPGRADQAEPFPIPGAMNVFYLCCCFFLPLKHLQLTSTYGYRIHPVTGNYSFHSGIDLKARHDTVFSVLGGRVKFMGYDNITGVHIRVKSGDFELLYGHLSQVFVLAGDSVHAGKPLGITGATGRVTGEHLHFAVRYRQAAINPLKFLNSLSNNLNK